MADAAAPPPAVALEVVEEDVELGPVVGTLRLQQLAPQSFNEACKSGGAADEEGGTDCTGQRVYAGCQTMVRFLANHPWLVAGRAVVELGCGVGACGLALAARLGSGKVVLTDGQPSTLELTRANAEALGLLRAGRASVRRLLFATAGADGADGDDVDACRGLLAEEGLRQGADVVVGCELMYYNVDPAAVLATAAALVRRGGPEEAEEETGSSSNSGGGSGGGGVGVVLLAHIFRGAHLPQALADAAAARGLWVLSVPVEAALTEDDRAGGASYWTNVSLLLCLPRAPGVGGWVGWVDGWMCWDLIGLTSSTLGPNAQTTGSCRCSSGGSSVCRGGGAPPAAGGDQAVRAVRGRPGRGGGRPVAPAREREGRGGVKCQGIGIGRWVGE